MGSWQISTEKLEALKRKYLLQLPERTAELERYYAQWVSNRNNKEALAACRNSVHKLAGSGATFGLDELSRQAARAEDILKTIQEGIQSPDSTNIEELDQVFRQLSAAAPQPPLEELNENGPVEEKSRDQASPPTQGKPKPIIYLMLDHPELNQDFSVQLENFGYEVSLVKALQELPDRINKSEHHVLVADIRLLELVEDAAATLKGYKKEYASQLSILYFSEYDSFELRLQGIRAGGDHFFTLPLDISQLIEKVDEIETEQSSEPFHILIIDDDPEQVSHHALLLQEAGMITSVASDPKRILNILPEGIPDIILMDLHMPECSGLELISVIRQKSPYLGVPIIILSYDKSPEMIREALLQGADDYLLKPIEPSQLTLTVINKSRRTRQLRRLMESDSLTGLLNHSSLKDQLNREVLRSDRSGAPVAFAMIDLDNFKSVNDTYGHLTGDRVLQSLARLLQNRLRRSDIIGRYGGEEFGIILLNTRREQAETIMNDIRTKFARIRHRAAGSEFKVTLSCGVAGYPGSEDAEELNSLADQALYEAKESGRNRVIVKAPPREP